WYEPLLPSSPPPCEFFPRAPSDHSAFQLGRSHAEMSLHALEELVACQAEFATKVELAVERVPGQPHKAEAGLHHALALQGNRAIGRLGTVARHLDQLAIAANLRQIALVELNYRRQRAQIDAQLLQIFFEVLIGLVVGTGFGHLRISDEG